jgi:hypothetical protein
VYFATFSGFVDLGNLVYLAVTDARLHLRALFDCASAATSSRRVTLCHQSLRDLAWWGNLPTNVHVGRGIWDASPSATLVTDASMEGWGAVLHAQTGNENTSSGAAPQTRAGVHQTFRTSVPARGLFIPSDAEPTSINQRELLAAIFGLQTFLPVARQQRVQLQSDSQVALAVIRNWT